MSGPGRSVAMSAAVVVAVAGFALALLGAHAEPAGYRVAPASTVEAPATVAPATAPPPRAEPSEASSDRAASEVGGLSLALVGTVIAALALVLAALILQSLRVRRRAGPRPHPDDVPRGHDLEPHAVADRLAAAASTALDDLGAEGPVSDVIITCWQRLRAAATQSGVPALASDTPAEAVLRMLRAGRVSPAAEQPLATLAGLYREARFSDHEMTRGDVWVAREALGAILAELQPAVRDGPQLRPAVRDGPRHAQ